MSLSKTLSPLLSIGSVQRKSPDTTEILLTEMQKITSNDQRPAWVLDNLIIDFVITQPTIYRVIRTFDCLTPFPSVQD